MVRKRKNIDTQKDLVPFALTEEAIKGSALIKSYRAEIEWRDGMPYLVSAPIRLSEASEDVYYDLLRKCLDLPYDGDDPALHGMSQGEAMMINLSRDAAIGDPKAREMIIDRILGKPQQNIKSVSLSGNLNDFLDKVASETQTKTTDVPIEEAEIVDPTEDL